MATYFISDLHLSPARPDITAGLFAFVQTHLRDAEALYLLGDIFDAWIGDDDDEPGLQAIKGALAALTADGLAVYFQRGNRDFLVGEQFAAQTGVELLPDSTIIDLYGRQALLLHGDTLCTGDAEYQKFRTMVRDDAWQAQILALPLLQRRALAAKMRAESQSLNAIKASDIMDVTPSEVVKVMRDAGVDLLIHGHTHRPAKHALTLGQSPAQRIVLGDWHHQGWYLKATADGSLALVEFPLGKLDDRGA